MGRLKNFEDLFALFIFSSTGLFLGTVGLVTAFLSSEIVFALVSMNSIMTSIWGMFVTFSNPEEERD